MDEARLGAFLSRVVDGYEALVSCERLTGGASRETSRVVVQAGGGERVFALRRAVGADETPLLGIGPGLDAEPLLFRAAHTAGVPGPGVVGVLEESDGLGAGFLMDWIEGETLGGRIARGEAFADVRGELAWQCGAALARIHSIDVEAAGLGAKLRTLSPEALIGETHGAYRSLGEPQPMIDFVGRWLLDNLPDAGPMRLVHGDFRNGNLMVSPEAGLRAVLDWELAHVGDPMRDLGWLCTRSWRFGGDGAVGGFGTRDELFAGYASVSGEAPSGDAVRFWEVFGSWWWAIGCLTMAQSWRADPDGAGIERAAIGRRSSECQIDLVNMVIPGAARLPDEGVDGDDLGGLPSLAELRRALALHDGAGAAEGDRGRFLARVADNVRAIVEREERLGGCVALREAEALRGMSLGGEAADMRAALCEGLWSGEIATAREDVRSFLRERVLGQVLIDQPGYPGAVEAQGRAG